MIWKYSSIFTFVVSLAMLSPKDRETTAPWSVGNSPPIGTALHPRRHSSPVARVTGLATSFPEHRGHLYLSPFRPLFFSLQISSFIQAIAFISAERMVFYLLRSLFCILIKLIFFYTTLKINYFTLLHNYIIITLNPIVSCTLLPCSNLVTNIAIRD